MDALLFTVHQHGTIPAFCHLNTRTCWGEDKGLPKLEVSVISNSNNSSMGGE